MEALKLAFDTIIVGALALPWLILIIDLFHRPKGPETEVTQKGSETKTTPKGPETEVMPKGPGTKTTPKGSETETIWSLLRPFLALIKGQGDNATMAVASVFLFAVAYFVGAAVTRVSGDFFNDDDLLLRIPVVRFPTEDNIRTDVYCDPVVLQFAQARGSEAGRTTTGLTTGNCQEAKGKKTLTTWKSGKLVVQNNLYCEPDDEKCKNSDPTIVNKDTVENAKQMIQQTFYLQEAALLLNGDKTDRLNQLHSQVLILRGAAFNGLITLVLCLFAIQPGRCPIWRPIAWVLPTVLVAFGFLILACAHIPDHGLDDPPFMEITAIVLGLAGVHMRVWGSRERVPYLTWLLTALLITLFAGFGWWWSEVLYDRLVLYSFYAMPN